MPDHDDPTQPGTPARELHGLDPGELLARGLHTVKMTASGGPWQPPTPEELAALLPQYRIQSLLGRGGMGAVYRGVQAALDRPVAIKLLPSELAGDGDFLARFQREARTLAKLQHSGIVAVHDFGQTSAGHLYFVMEYVDGTDLQQVLKGPGLKPEQAFVLIAQICDALHYAHGQGVIHRDIKPANILLTKDGRAKVADFGLARPLTGDSGGLTVTNMVMGTPDYMAPEQRTSATHADHRADIFALGVMLYEMLTGQRPHGAFQPPSHRVQVDVRIDEVVLKALQQEPDRRYQQASEMKQDVERIRTTPPEKPKATKKPKSKGLLIAAVVVLAVLASLLVAHFAVQRPAPEQTKQSAPSLKWQRVERPEAEWKADGFAVHGGWAEYGASDGMDRRWAIHDTANERPEQLRDVAVRARFRWVDGTGTGGSGARISLRTRTGANNVEAMAELWKHQLRVVFPPQQRYPERSLRKPMESGQEGILEMAVINTPSPWTNCCWPATGGALKSKASMVIMGTPSTVSSAMRP